MSGREHFRPVASGWAYGLSGPCVAEVEGALESLQQMWDYCDDAIRNGRTFGATPGAMRQWSRSLTVVELLAKKYLERPAPEQRGAEECATDAGAPGPEQLAGLVDKSAETQTPLVDKAAELQSQKPPASRPDRQVYGGHLVQAAAPAAIVTFQPNDRVNWAIDTGLRGVVLPVPAIVRQVSAQHVEIELAQRIAGQWVRVNKQVAAERLFPRADHIPGLDEGEG